jgi:hypothetical protein
MPLNSTELAFKYHDDSFLFEYEKSLNSETDLKLLAYLDNGVLSRLLKKPPAEFQVQFDKTLEGICRKEGRGSVLLAHSPAIFLELLSITTRPFSGVHTSPKNSLEWFQSNGEAARAHFEMMPELTTEHFRTKYNCEVEHVTQEGKSIFTALLQPK